MNIVAACLSKDSGTDTCSRSQSFRLTSETLYGADTQVSTKATVISFLQAFHVSHSPLPEIRQDLTTSATCGPRPQMSFAQYSLNPFCLKTCQDLFPAVILEPSLVTWPRWGMWGGGELLELETVERPTSVTGSGLWPTPRASEIAAGASMETVGNIKKPLGNLEELVYQRTWPTPVANDAKNHTMPPAAESWDSIPGEIIRGGFAIQGMFLNPEWVEWLQGWPMGWTGLKPLATDNVAQWLDAHGKS